MTIGSIRAVFFDAGNTLIFPRLDDVARALTDFGYPSTAEDFLSAERTGKHKLDEQLWPQIRRGEVPPAADKLYWYAYLHALMERKRVPQEAREHTARFVAERFRDLQLWSVCPPDTKPVLERLSKQGYLMGVISNSVGTMELRLQQIGLAQYFTVILDSAVVGVEKPNPEIFRLALQRAQVAATEALFVGDSHSIDIGGARLAGLHGVLLDRIGAYSQVDCPRITSLSELPDVLSQL